MKSSSRAKFCSECGADLFQLRPAALPASGAEASLRFLVVMFCDLVDSTALAARLDPELWRQLLMEYQRTVRVTVTRHGGYVARVIGDGILIYFGWPDAHEDDGERAIHAGLAVLDELTTLNSLRFHGARPELHVRVALHAGRTLVDGTGEAFGETPHIAARIQSVALPDWLVITDTLYEIIRGKFEVEGGERHDFKGVSRPIGVFRVLGRHDQRHGRSTAMLLAPLVERTGELQLLSSLFAQVQESGGQIVTISGEPGIGKSRLVEELHNAIADTHCRWLCARSAASFESAALWPIVEMMRESIAHRHDEPAAMQLARLSESLAHTNLEGEGNLFLVAELLGLPLDSFGMAPMLSADEKRQRLLAVLCHWIVGSSPDRPTVFVLEDLHWADPSTQELVGLLAARAPRERILLITTTRSSRGCQDDASSLGVHIALDRLNDDAARRLVASLGQGRSLSADIVDAVVRRADGVPVFIEELTRFVADQNASGIASKVPDTIAASLMARLERLGSASQIAHLCAVIGTTVPYPIVRALSSLSDVDLRAALDRLVESGVLVAEGEGEQPTYRFRHALLHEAAYATLLASRRRGLHRRTAAILQHQFPSISERNPETMARHWLAAREPWLAVSAWISAGGLAARRRAFKEARDAYRQALSALMALLESPERDARELEIRYALFGVLQVTQGYSASDLAENTARARQLTEKSGDVIKLISLATGSWAALSSAGDYAAAGRLANEIEALAARHGGPESLAHAHMVQLTAYSRIGDLHGAERHFRAGLPYFGVVAFRRKAGAIAQTYGNASKVIGLLGRTDAALERARHALEVATKNDNPYDLAFANHMAATAALSLGLYEWARECGRHAVELADEHRFPQFAAIARVALGRAVAELENAPAGIALIRHGLENMTRNGARAAITIYLTWLAEAHELNGMTATALETIEQALAANPEERIYQAEALRIRGVLRIADDDTERGEADVRRALQVAVDMGALRFQIRASSSLARILTDRGRRVDGRDLLEPLCSDSSLDGLDRDVEKMRLLFAELA